MKKITLLAMLLSMSIVIAIVESFIPTIVIGVKLGLANIVTLIVIYLFRIKDAISLVILRVLIVSLLLGTFLSYVFFMSLSGGIISLIVMLLMKKAKVFNIITISAIGAFSHSFGQIIIAMGLISFASIYYLPVMALLSVVAGIIIGVIANYGLRVLDSKNIYNSL